MSLATEYDELLSELAPDWSDLAFELILHDEMLFDAARLYMAPAQLRRTAGERNRFTFRVSRERGYGAHPGLVASCLAKLDEASISGELELLRVLHEVQPNQTQGPAISTNI